MKCLFVDIASHKGVIACVTESSVVAFEDVHDRIADDELIVGTENLLATAEWAYTDLTHIACVIGPGGFTSLRIGVSFANTLADQLRIPLCGIHLSDLYAARSPQTDFCWLHSTKKEEIFARGFGSFSSIWEAPEHLNLDDFIASFPKGTPWAGELIPDHLAKIRALQGVEMPLTNAKSILPEFLNKSAFSDQILNPWYGRKY